jgi:hypothetical protein
VLCRFLLFGGRNSLVSPNFPFAAAFEPFLGGKTILSQAVKEMV